MSIKQEAADQLLVAGIHLDEFDLVMSLIDSDEADTIVWSGDPVADFKTAIIMVNDRGSLPASLSDWCDQYGVEWQDPGIQIPNLAVDL